MSESEQMQIILLQHLCRDMMLSLVMAASGNANPRKLIAEINVYTERMEDLGCM